mmetsp:Transcript_41239/g.101214  ORF Transcript_41239/g.101214 Transcript_41239/m.101214 type:complete len:486 (-) Transcript_41239:241-1698(-)
MDAATPPAGPSQAKADADSASGFEKFWKERNEDLNRKSKKELTDLNERPLDKWFTSAQVLSRQLDLQKDQGELTMYYILSLRFVDLVFNTLPEHPEWKQKLQKHTATKKELKRQVEAMLPDMEKAKEKIKKHAEKDFKELQELQKKRAEQALRFDTLSLGDHMDSQRAHISAGDAMIREGMKGMPARTGTWPSAGASQGLQYGPPYASLSGAQAAQRQMEEEPLAIGLPIMDDGGADIPYILPKNNRMTFDTFVQHERKQPSRPVPVRDAPRPAASYAPPAKGMSISDAQDADLQRALAESAAMARGEDSKMVRLRQRLETYTEFELEDVDNTGHCQFDAVAHQIAGRFTYAYGDRARNYTWKNVRRDVAAWLRHNASFKLENGETISDFLDTEDGRNWDEFCDNVEDKFSKTSPLWGNHLTLIAAANCYQRPIRVWSTAPGNDWWLQIEPQHHNKTNPVKPFELAHLYERHYMSVTERKTPKRS